MGQSGEDLERERQLQAQLLEQYNASGAGRQAPQAGMPTLAPTERAVVAPGQAAQQADATTIGLRQQAEAAQQRAPTQANLAQAAAPRDVGAAQINRAGTQAGPTMIDQSQQGQFRSGQNALAQSLQQTIAGQGPSVAQEQLRQGTDRNIASQFALAHSQHGYGAAGALLNAQDRAADLNQQLVSQSAQLRAQETAAAQGTLGGVLAGARGQDIGLAGQQANLTADQQRLNAQLNAHLSGQQAGFEQEAGQAGAARSLQQQMFNAGQGNQFNLAQRAQDIGIGATNAGFQQQANIFNSAQDQQQKQLQAQLYQQQQIFNTGQGNEMTRFNRGMDASLAMFNAGQGNQRNEFGGNLAMQTNLANQRSQLTQEQIDQERQRMLLQSMLQQQGGITSGNALAYNMYAGDRQREIDQERNRMAFFGQLLGTAGAMAVPR